MAETESALGRVLVQASAKSQSWSIGKSLLSRLSASYIFSVLFNVQLSIDLHPSWDTCYRRWDDGDSKVAPQLLRSHSCAAVHDGYQIQKPAVTLMKAHHYVTITQLTVLVRNWGIVFSAVLANRSTDARKHNSYIKAIRLTPCSKLASV